MIKKTFIGFTLLISGLALAVTANAATTCLLPSSASSGSQIVTCATQTGVSNATNTLAIKTKDGLIRTYTVHLPPSYDKTKSYKLVVALHGGFGSGASMEAQTNLSKVADMRTGEKFIIVYPDGYKDVARAWNAGGCCGSPVLKNIDDVSFIKELVASLKTKYSISRVYATGMSNGGMLANRLACEAFDIFTRVAPVSGTIQVPTCTPTKPVGILMVHGTADTRVPYNGGFGTGKPTAGVTFVSIPKTLSDWAIRNKCSANLSTTVIPPLTNDGITIDKLRYSKCLVPTMLYRVNGGSHSWPGGTATGINILEDKSPTQSLNTSKVILDFFAGTAINPSIIIPIKNPPVITNTPPIISGTPATSVTLGNSYNFTPTTTDINGDPLTFTITNKPTWAIFNAKTGALSGTPTTIGTTTGIKISVTDRKSTAVSLPVFSVVVNRSATPPTPPIVTKKYTPGHYITIGGGDVKKLDDSQTDLTDGLVFATELKNSGVKGVVVRYLWKDLEPTMDVYNFTRIKNHLDLLQSVGLKTVIFIDDKAFSGPTPLPSYLMANSDYYFINTMGAHSATRWNPYVLTRFNSLFTKMGAQFDSHPALEGVTYQETSSQLSASTVTVPPYDPVLYKETIIKTLTNQATAFPKSNVFWMMNFIGSGYHNGVFMKNPESQALIRDIANATMPLGVIMGGPDILPEETSLTTRTYPFYKEFSAKGMKLFGSAQNDSFRELHSTSTGSAVYPTRFWTPLEIFQYGRDELHINYLFWNYKTWLSKTTDAKYGGPGEYVWADAIPVIKANPVFNPVTPKKFNLNQKIKTTANVNVRSTSTTSILGTQALGAVGIIVTDPLNVISTTIPNPKWWKVDFGTGIDGWINEDYVVGSDGIVTVSPVVSTTTATTAKVLFKSNFGKGVTLSPLYSFYTSGKGAWQDLKGTDSETGYSFPATGIPNQNFSGIQWITYATVTPATIGENISTEIREVIGPVGKPVNELFTSVKKKGPLGVGSAQAQFMVRRDHKYGDVNDMYITYWAKHPADLITKLDPTVSSANWQTQFEFKTGGYENTGNGDYRIQTTILKNKDGKLYWMSKGDNGANGPFPFVDYWVERNYDVPVVLDKWFKYEVYWHRSAGADGRYWTAVDGQVLFDHKGPNMGDYNLPINRIFFAPAYSGGNTPVESHITGLEIWDGFPCGEGKSCYKKP